MTSRKEQELACPLAQTTRTIAVVVVRWYLHAVLIMVPCACLLLPTAPLALCAAELALMVCGPPQDALSDTADFDFRDVFHVTEDSDFLDAHELRDSFWHVVTQMSPLEKRGLLLFATGVSRLPAPKTELMAVELLYMAAPTSSVPPLGAASPWPTAQNAPHAANATAAVGRAAAALVLGRVPSAHTCDNVLEVPDYWSALVALAGYDPKKGVPVPGVVLDVLQQQVRPHSCYRSHPCTGRGVQD